MNQMTPLLDPVLQATIFVAGKPTAKQRVRFTREGQQPFTPQKTVNYEGRLAHAATEVMNGRPAFQGPLQVWLAVAMPVPVSWSKKKQALALSGGLYPTGRPDLDNYAKMLDALNLIAWVDDSQIISLHVNKYYSQNPGMTVRIYTLMEPVEKNDPFA